MDAVQKVFISQDNTATFSCPKCGKTKTTDVSRFNDVTTEVRLKVKCPCGHSHTIFLERRKHIRKNLNLTGTFTRAGGTERGHLIVTDLSRSGMKLRIGGGKTVAVDEKLAVSFFLDDPKRSQVEKQVVVRSVSGRLAGVEFLFGEHYDQLGTYLLYHF